MPNYPNVTLRKGPRPGESIVMFHGHPIGTVRKVVNPYATKKHWRTRWLIHLHDANDNHNWTRDTRDAAVAGCVHYYMEGVGSSSSLHNSWVRRVETMLADAEFIARGGDE